MNRILKDYETFKNHVVQRGSTLVLIYNGIEVDLFTNKMVNAYIKYVRSYKKIDNLIGN